SLVTAGLHFLSQQQSCSYKNYFTLWPESPMLSGSGMAGGWLSSGGLGGTISPAANTSSIKGIMVLNNRLVLNTSRQAKRTSLSGLDGFCAARSEERRVGKGWRCRSS